MTHRSVSRRRLFGLAASLAAMAAAPPVLATLPGAPVDGKHFIRITVQVNERLPAAIQELAELLPLAADCDVRTRAQLVELFEAGRHFVDTVDLHRTAALGAGEWLIVFQPSDRLLLCVAALRALRRDGNIVHQAHIESSRGRLATPMVDGRAPGVECRLAPGVGHSAGAA